MTMAERAAIEAIRAQAYALVTQADALLSFEDPKCCDDPQIIDESTCSGTNKRCANCGALAPVKEQGGVDGAH